MNLILFGFPGCGKTYYARALSAAIQRSFIDTDDRIIAMYKEQSGKIYSIRVIHEVLGDKIFREWERQSVFALEAQARSIIAVGGGAVLDPSSVQHLSSIGRLVYLKSDFEKLKRRILQRGIPSFVDPHDPIGSLHKIYLERLPLYASISSRSIDVDSQEDIVAQLSEEFYAL